jgi:hypothetical protein
VLVMMALITTVMTVPALRLLGLFRPERTAPTPPLLSRPAGQELHP